MRHGLRAFAIDSAAGPADLVIANNSFSANGGWAVKLTQDDGGHTIFNNVLLSDVGSVAVEHAVFGSDSNIVGNVFSLDGETTVIAFPPGELLAWGVLRRSRPTRGCIADLVGATIA